MRHEAQGVRKKIGTDPFHFEMARGEVFYEGAIRFLPAEASGKWLSI